MRLNSFSVEGFRNLRKPVTFGPLQTVNVLHGPNSAGKSNLLQAMDVFFRLLGTGNQISNSIRVSLEDGEEAVGCPFPHLFNLAAPGPIQWKVELSIDAAELEEMSIEPELPTDAVTIVAELTPALGSAAQLRIAQFLLGEQDLARLDPEKDEGVGFGQTIRSYVAGMLDLNPAKRCSPFRRLDLRRASASAPDASGLAPTGLVPPAILDALFDARQSLDREQRARWNLFAQMARELEPELGAGQFETAFDRKSGRAGLVYDTEAATYPVEWLGSGVQQVVALLALLALSRSLFVALEEPELHLAEAMQERLPVWLQMVLESGLGAKQLFVCTQSRALDATAESFVLEPGEEGPTVSRRAWEGASSAQRVARAPAPATNRSSASPSGSGEARPKASPVASSKAASPAAPAAPSEGADLDNLIGLVDQLAELEPEEILSAEAASAATRRPGARR